VIKCIENAINFFALRVLYVVVIITPILLSKGSGTQCRRGSNINSRWVLRRSEVIIVSTVGKGSNNRRQLFLVMFLTFPGYVTELS